MGAMQLTDDQKQTVKSWIAGGLSMSEVQEKIRTEFQVSVTYMETRLLVSELEVMPVNPEPEAPRKPEGASDDGAGGSLLDPKASKPAGGGVSVTEDEITNPNAIISGKVVFSDGERAAWYVDQMGRLGLQSDTPNYRPSESDIASFQRELERLARKRGL